MSDVIAFVILLYFYVAAFAVSFAAVSAVLAILPKTLVSRMERRIWQ